MTEREALKLALEALKGYRRELNDDQPCDAEQDIEKLLAQPEQEPVATCKQSLQVEQLLDEMLELLPYNTPDYWIGRIKEALRESTTPPQRTWEKPWVSLTDEEFQLIYDMGRTPAGMMEMVEAKLKEKNT